MKKFVVLLLILIFVLTSGVALALDTSDALYTGLIRITNNGTAATNVAVPFTANTSVYIDAGYMESSANNTAITSSSGANLPYMPGFAGNKWIVFVPSIGANNILNDTLFMGGTTDMAGKLRYFPASGGMATADSASLEPSANFTFEQIGWINTDNGTDKNLVSKPGAFRIYVSPTVSGNITAAFTDWQPSSTWIIPTGGSGWTDNANARDGNTGTYAQYTWTSGNGTGLSSYITQTLPATYSNQVRYYATRSHSFVDNVEIDVYYSGGWNNILSGSITVGSYVTANIGSEQTVSQIRLRANSNDDSSERWVRLHELDVNEAEVYDTASTSITGISSGEHTVSAYIDTIAVNLDGTGSYLDAGGDASLRVNGTDFTVEMWVKFDVINIHQGLFKQLTGVNDAQSVYWHNVSNLIFWRVFNPGIVVDYSKSWNPTADTWYYLAFIHSGNNWDVYVDAGASLGTVVDGDDIRNDVDTTYLGVGAGANYLDGDIDEIRWYTRAIGAGERTTNYNAGAGTGIIADQTNLQGWWHLDEGSGIVAFDETANSNDIDLIANVTWIEGNGVVPSLIVDVDGVGRGGGYSASGVPDTSDNWTFLQNDVMTYMESHQITIGGTLQQSIAWEYGSTFTDLSGNSHDAIPSFRSISTDADVSAALVSFSPITEARAPAFTVNITTSGWITAPDTQLGNFTTTTNSTYPGSDIIVAVTTDGDTPVQLLELILAGVIVLSLSLFISWIMRTNREGSLLFKILTITAGLGIMIAVGIVDSWILYLFLMISIALAMGASQKTFTGTGNSGNNMIGFLAMAFVGMTTINRILEGRFIQSTDVDVLRNTLAFQPFEVFGLFTIPVPNTAFLLNGIPSLLRWDYSFFGGNAQIFQYMLYSITAVVSFMLFVLVFGAIYQMFSRGR